MLFGATRYLGAAREQIDRVGEPTGIGQRAGEDDAPFGHEGRRRRRLAQLFPQLFDVAQLALGAPAVHEHRMLLGRAAQLRERDQVVGCDRVEPEAVTAESGELAHRSRAGVRLGEGTQDA